MFSSPGRPSSAPTPSSRTVPSRSRSPAADPGTATTDRTAGESARLHGGGERRLRPGRPDGTGRHPRDHTPIHRHPQRATQAGAVSWMTDPHRQRQSFTWWSGTTATSETENSRIDPRDLSGRALLPITDGRGWPRRPGIGATLPPQGGGSSPAPPLTVTICLTCGQPILQAAGQPSIPGTQPLPAGSSRRALAERIGWRYLQTAVDQLQTDPYRALDIARTHWHPPLMS